MLIVTPERDQCSFDKPPPAVALWFLLETTPWKNQMRGSSCFPGFLGKPRKPRAWKRAPLKEDTPWTCRILFWSWTCFSVATCDVRLDRRLFFFFARRGQRVQREGGGCKQPGPEWLSGRPKNWGGEGTEGEGGRGCFEQQFSWRLGLKPAAFEHCKCVCCKKSCPERRVPGVPSRLAAG